MSKTVEHRSTETMKIEYKTPKSVRDPITKSGEGQNICRTNSKKKVCIDCKEATTNFNKKQSRCKKCQSEYKANYYVKNKKHINAKSSEWRENNPERNKELKRKWEIKPENKKAKLEYLKQHKINNPNYRIICNMRRRLGHVMAGKKPAKTMELLGCTAEQLKTHLESLFKPEMVWENYGQWHVDHIIPLSSFDLLDEVQVKIACNFKNLQPLWAKENLVKSNKIF